MKKIVVFGSFIYDLVTSMNRFPKAGESVIGTTFESFPGGKGANQCIAVKRLGGNVEMIGKVGNDEYGKKFINIFKEEGIDVSSIEVSQTKSTGVGNIQLNKKGQNRICVILGANLDFDSDNLEKNKKIIENADYFLTQFEMDIEITNCAIKYAKEKGLVVVVNPAPAREIDDEIVHLIDYLTPNETELEFLSGIKINSIEDAVNGCNVLIKKGVKNLVVTLDSKGCLYVSKEKSFLVPGYKVDRIDSVGAGDSFNGALVVSLANGKNIEESLKFANAMGALTVTQKGAIPSLQKIDVVNEFVCNNKNLEIKYL